MTSLVILLVMSMVVLAALRSGLLEERMAANASNRQLALQAAESVTRNAEASLFEPGQGFYMRNDINTGGNGYYATPLGFEPLKWNASDWSDNNKTLTVGTELSGVDTQPRYIVEIIERPGPLGLSSGCSTGLLGITSRGLGRDSAAVFVHAMYRYQAQAC